MVIREVEVKKDGGVQRNDCHTIVQRAMRYVSSIAFEKKACKVNAKSLMGILSLGLKQGDKVMIIVNGEDQDDAIEEMAKLFEGNFN